MEIISQYRKELKKLAVRTPALQEDTEKTQGAMKVCPEELISVYPGKLSCFSCGKEGHAASRID